MRKLFKNSSHNWIWSPIAEGINFNSLTFFSLPTDLNQQETRFLKVSTLLVQLLFFFYISFLLLLRIGENCMGFCDWYSIFEVEKMFWIGAYVIDIQKGKHLTRKIFHNESGSLQILNCQRFGIALWYTYMR